MSFYKATVSGNNTNPAIKTDTADSSVDKEDKENNDVISVDDADSSDSSVDKEDNDLISVDDADSSDSPVDKEDNDLISVDGVDSYMNTNAETLVLSSDPEQIAYISATDTCIAFGIFFLIGLLLARMTWGRFK